MQSYFRAPNFNGYGVMVDGRNPASVDRWFIPSCIGFQPSKVVQDFFHPQYPGGATSSQLKKPQSMTPKAIHPASLFT